MLNGLWLGFFVVGAAAGLIQWLMLGDTEVFSRMVASLFDMAKLSVDVMILLFGTLTLWLGLLRIAEQAGLVNTLGRWLAPLFARLMPGVPRGHPALGLITMNFAANGLGLDNAATPVGLKAMRELQTLNPNPNVATDAQILFLVLNTSSLTLLPVTIFMYRLQQGAPESDPGIPTDSAGHRCLHPGWIFSCQLDATLAATRPRGVAVARRHGLTAIRHHGRHRDHDKRRRVSSVQPNGQPGVARHHPVVSGAWCLAQGTRLRIVY